MSQALMESEVADLIGAVRCSPVSGRVRNAATTGSSSPQMRDTSDLEIPSRPSAFTKSSTFRVETPCTYASCTTASQRVLRAATRLHMGKWLGVRDGIRNWLVTAA